MRTNCDLCENTFDATRFGDKDYIVVRLEDSLACKPVGFICIYCNERLRLERKLGASKSTDKRSIPIGFYIALVELFGLKVLDAATKD
jgi:hypothetical protein